MNSQLLRYQAQYYAIPERYEPKSEFKQNI